ncbi:MAG: hypothetical protein ACKOZU_09250 [Planctomycetaceae bacterium]
MDAVRCRDSIARATAGLAACGLLVACVGCQTGSSWMAKPSWMPFGQKEPEAGPLSSKPALAGDVQKPSATAKPYPTTSTPESYAIPDAASQASTAPGASPAAVTYGSTPPPATTTTAATGGSVAPQVGPYSPSSSALPQEAPATGVGPAAATPSAWTAANAAGNPPPPVSTAPPPWAGTPAAAQSQRYADARAASPTWTPGVAEAQPGDGRYEASGTSRFTGGAVPSVGPAAPAVAEPPPADGLSPPAGASRFTNSATPAAAASMLPSIGPAVTPAAPAELQPPASTPPLPAPSAPQRRPDPGYRPGGTSNYRTTRSSLAAEPPSGVQPASFESPAGRVN